MIYVSATVVFRLVFSLFLVITLLIANPELHYYILTKIRIFFFFPCIYSKGESICLVTGEVLERSGFYLTFFFIIIEERPFIWMFSADEYVINAFGAGNLTWWRWRQKSCMTIAMNPAWAVFPAQYELVGWVNACQILPKFKHYIIPIVSLTGVLQITSTWDIVSIFLKKKETIADYSLFFKPQVLC